jgi:hypothetical protein
MQVRRNLFVRLGAGDDALEITNLRALAAYLNGGYGTNSMTTRAGKERRSLSGA